MHLHFINNETVYDAQKCDGSLSESLPRVLFSILIRKRPIVHPMRCSVRSIGCPLYIPLHHSEKSFGTKRRQCIRPTSVIGATGEDLPTEPSRVPSALMRRVLNHLRSSGRTLVTSGESSLLEMAYGNVSGYHAGFSNQGLVGMRGTTVLCVRKDGQVVMMADGQVTMGSEILKPNVKKVRRLGDNVIGGFAGATADAFTLFERLEHKLDEHPGQLTRAAVELAKLWRTDKFLRRLDAVMVVADKEQSLQITGNGDVLEPHDGIIGIGSGGSYAVSAARALIDLPDMDALQIARRAMNVAADICIYTNHNFVTEAIGVELESKQ